MLASLILGKLEQMDVDKLLAKMACGQVKEVPFPEEATAAIRGEIRAHLDQRGFAVQAQDSDQEQPVDVRLLGALLKDCQDPDWKVAEVFARGVCIGVGVKLPRTPAV